MAQDGGWFQSRLGEAVAIVLSILVAFGIDAGWDLVKERREEMEALRALRVEYVTNLREIDGTLRRNARGIHLGRWGLSASDEQIARLTDREAAEILMSLAVPFTFDANLGTTEALKSSGRLSLLRDEELQRLLMEFATGIEDMQEDRAYRSTWANDIWRTAVEEGGPWIDPDVASAVLPGIPVGPGGPPPGVVDLQRVRRSSTLPGLVRRYHLLTEIYAWELSEQRAFAQAIVDRLPASSPPRAGGGHASRAVLLDPGHPAWSEMAPDSFDLRFETTTGPFVLRAYRSWAPVGVDRLWNLARHGFYEDARFHRVVPGFITQFGISGDPEVDAVWYDRGMPDDPVVGTNVRGTVAFAFTEPGTRSTQLYINMVDNTRLDADGFAPVGRIVSGMQWAVDSIYGGYGERSGGGVRRGNQAPLVTGGNAWIDREYPELDRVVAVELAGGG